MAIHATPWPALDRNATMEIQTPIEQYSTVEAAKLTADDAQTSVIDSIIKITTIATLIRIIATIIPTAAITVSYTHLTLPPKRIV